MVPVAGESLTWELKEDKWNPGARECGGGAWWQMRVIVALGAPVAAQEAFAVGQWG